MSADAAERELWERLGYQFAEDDGSLPEVELSGLTPAGATRVYTALLALAEPLDGRFTLWSGTTVQGR